MKLCRNSLILMLALTACGGDSGAPEDTSEAESPVAGDDDAGTGSCVTGLESVDLAPDAPPAYTCDGQPSTMYPESPNACRNDADCALIETEQVRRFAKDCALTCRDIVDCEQAAACNRQCVGEASQNQLGGTLTPACSGCYAQAALCGLEKCYAECADDADSLDCVACSFKQGCRIPFERCSGLDRKP
jgi:hypothetical protein